MSGKKKNWGETVGTDWRLVNKNVKYFQGNSHISWRYHLEKDTTNATDEVPIVASGAPSIKIPRP